MCEFCEKLETGIGDADFKGYTLEFYTEENELILYNYDDFITSFQINFSLFVVENCDKIQFLSGLEVTK